MARELEVDKKQGIEQLFASGMPKRQIARTLGIDRKSVDRHVARFQSKGATSEEAPTGEAPTGSDDSKGAKAPIHPRMEKGKFSTMAEHIAPAKINGIERGAKYLLHKVKLIGPQSTRWAEGALSEHGVPGMRIIQGLLSLTHKYKTSEIERAAETAWRSGSFRCRTIKRLLEHGGAEQQTMEFMDEHPVIRSILEYDQFFKQALAGG